MSTMIEKMGSFWLFVPHLVRGITGIILNSHIPVSHEIVKALNFQEETGSLSFAQIHSKVKKDVERQFFFAVKDLNSNFKLYAVLTVICLVFDFINFILTFRDFAVPGKEYEDLTVLILCLIFCLKNIYWAGYVYLLHLKFPEYMSKYMTNALLGISNFLDKKMTSIANKLAQRRRGGAEAD